MTHFQTSNSILMIKENISNATTNNNQDELGMSISNHEGFEVLDVDPAFVLHHACASGSNELIMSLLQTRCISHEADCNGKTPLALYASRSDSTVEMIHVLAKANRAALTVLDSDGMPPLSLDQKDMLIEYMCTSK